MPSPDPITLYDALTGNSTLVDAGDGYRPGPWLQEVSRWLHEAAEPIALKGLNLARLVNYPTFLPGEGDRELRSNPIGGDTNPIGTWNGIRLFEVVKNSVQIGTGDGSETDFGAETLTEPDPAALNYATGGTDGDPAAPRGGAHPAFITSEDGSTNFNLGATDGVLTIVVNGASFAVTVGTGAATTPESIVAAIVNAGVPVNALIADVGVTDRVRLLTHGTGAAQTIRVVATAGTAGATVFSGSGNTTFRGSNGPLNDVRNTTDGLRDAHRILPGSVTLTATIGAAVVTVTDADRDGTLDDGTGTHTGTITYATGAFDVDFGTAPDNATAVTAEYSALIELDLARPVRVPAFGRSFALLVL